jgi:hypothetical protein
MNANPTIDVVMHEVIEAITTACAPLAVDADAVSTFRDEFQPKFNARLTNGSWHIDKINVLLAARQCGVIAQAIATLRHQPRIDSAVFLEAGQLVRRHCNDVFKEGVWCS